ncbi:MAG TPA: GNAT family protein [Pyrinomonadaceae bacterium]|nr:GNAT family protein [Pyrinomonadaceae bacterium]
MPQSADKQARAPRPAEGGDVRLLPMRAEHAHLWLRWREQAASQRFNPLLRLPVEHLARRLTVACTSDLKDRTRGEYRWMVAAAGQPVGTVAATNVSWGMGYAEISYMLDEAHHGRGLGTRAVAHLVGKLFRETDLHRLYALISPENLPSLRLVERLGFTQEGRMRQHYLIQGRRVDELVYGLLRHEWKNSD